MEKLKDRGKCRNNLYSSEELIFLGWAQWLKPVIPATWEAEIRRFMFQGQTRQKFMRPTQLIKVECFWYIPIIPAREEA
jgi:hypothetical protein